jgi:transposase
LLRTYKDRIYPKDQQIKVIDTTISLCRLFYNCMLEHRVGACPHCGLSIHRDVNAARNILVLAAPIA